MDFSQAPTAQAPAPGLSFEGAASLIRALRKAAAMCREGDWRGVRDDFLDHDFRPLAALSGGTADALLSFPAEQIGPDQVLSIMAPEHREIVADLLGIFGMLR